VTDEPNKAALAASFDAAADTYEKARPSYPDEAIDWLLAAHPREVLDLGAGTGKLTRALVGRVDTVFAVDPSPNMLAELGAAVPEAIAAVGSAEQIPLPDACVDAVLAAQAWHWVRIYITLTPVCVEWWPDGRMDGPARSWWAPTRTAPASDPPPTGSSPGGWQAAHDSLGEDQEGSAGAPSNREQKKSPRLRGLPSSPFGLDPWISSGPPPGGNGPVLTVPIRSPRPA